MLGLGLGLGMNPSALDPGPMGRLSNLTRPSKVILVGDSKANTAGAPGGTEGTGSWLPFAVGYTDRCAIAVFNQSGYTAAQWVASGRRLEHLEVVPDVLLHGFGENSLDIDPTMSGARSAFITMHEDFMDANPDGIHVICDLQPSLNALTTYNAQALLWQDIMDEMVATYPNNVVKGPPTLNLWETADLGTYTWDTVHNNYAGMAMVAEAYRNWITPYVANVPTITEYLDGLSFFNLTNRSVSSGVGNSGQGSPVGTATITGAFAPANGLTTNSYQVSKTGGTTYRCYNRTIASAGVTSNTWYLATYKYKGSLLGGDAICYATQWFSNGSADKVTIIAHGQPPVDAWCTIAWLVKSGTHAGTNMRIDMKSSTSADTSSTGILSFSDFNVVPAETDFEIP